jgi:hypothetical protein
MASDDDLIDVCPLMPQLARMSSFLLRTPAV